MPSERADMPAFAGAMLSRRALIASAAASPLAAFLLPDADVERLMALSALLVSLPLSADALRLAHMVRTHIVELPHRVGLNLRDDKHQLRLRLIRIMATTSLIPGFDSDVRVFWIWGEVDAAGMRLTHRINRSVGRAAPGRSGTAKVG